MRRFLVRLACRSEWSWRDALNDLRWDHGIDTLNQEWRAGEGSAVVECFGAIDTVTQAFGALGLADSVVEIVRTA